MVTRFPIFTATLLLAVLASGCQVTTKDTRQASLGKAVTEQEMLEALQAPGSVVFRKHVAAKWEVPLSGLLNLDHPKARAAQLEDREEAIEIYTYSLIHPTQGKYLIDSGVSSRFQGEGRNPHISPVVNAVMRIEKLQVITTTAEIINQLSGIDGVFLTHIHLDHIIGLTDVDDTVPVFIGPDDATLRDFVHLFTQGTTNRLLQRQTELKEWAFTQTGIIDVFSDGSLFAVHAPGHTPGTTAYIANTKTGVHVMLGDVTHTAWGWQNQVEPGTYSYDLDTSAVSLANITRIVDAIAGATVHPGHQQL